MWRFALAFFAVNLICTPAQSQEETVKNRLELKIGAGYLVRQDRIFSPMIHKDLSLIDAGLEFTRQSKFYHNLSLEFSMFNPSVSESFNYFEDGELKSAFPHSFILVNLSYVAGKTFQAGKGELTAGLLVNSDIQALNYVYGRISNFGYFSAIGAGGFIKYSLAAGERGRASAFLKLPVVSLYSRSPYLVNDDEFIENISSHSGIKTFLGFLADGDWETLTKLQYFYTGAGYEYDFRSNLGIAASWMLDFVHVTTPRKLLSIKNSVYLSFYLMF